jgi:hypothetical protein
MDSAPDSTPATAPALDRRAHSAKHLAIAARTWGSLLAQEETSRRMTARLVRDLERFGAPRAILDDARRVATDEARHVEVCADVVRALGFEPERPGVEVPALPASDAAFEQAMVELLVAGFAVAETMSVGGFVAVRSVTREPVARWAYAQLARDEVRHGLFGEVAGKWAMQGWSAERRRALWPACVSVMESFERRVTGGAPASDVRSAPLEALGAPAGSVTAGGLLRSVEVAKT